MQRNDAAIQAMTGFWPCSPAMLGADLAWNGPPHHGRPELALADYDRALALNPTLDEAQYNRGVALLDLQRTGDALAAFDAVMPSYHSNAEMLNNRGVVLWNMKRPAEALEA